jgi:trehalose 6-phosphate phosphatase
LLEARRDDRADGCGKPDERGVAVVDLAAKAVQDGSGERDHTDRGERGPGRRPRVEPQYEDQQRHDDDPTADAEERAEEPGSEPDERQPHRRIVVSGPVSAPVRLVRFRSAPELAAVLLDLDGTLAPIVERPEDAAVPDEARREVERLCDRYALVACISGRPAAEVTRLVGVDGVEAVGVHGLEGDPEAERYTPRLRELAASVDWPWTVEEKAGVTLSFHYREADDPSEAERRAEDVARAAEAVGLRPHRGRKVLEVRPPVAADKGTAVGRILDGRSVRAALYAGDDTTDLDAFRGLDEAKLDVALKVAVASPEMNPVLLNAADFVVDGPAGLLELLRQV